MPSGIWSRVPVCTARCRPPCSPHGAASGCAKARRILGLRLTHRGCCGPAWTQPGQPGRSESSPQARALTAQPARPPWCWCWCQHQHQPKSELSRCAIAKLLRHVPPCALIDVRRVVHRQASSLSVLLVDDARPGCRRLCGRRAAAVCLCDIGLRDFARLQSQRHVYSILELPAAHMHIPACIVDCSHERPKECRLGARNTSCAHAHVHAVYYLPRGRRHVRGDHRRPALPL